MVPYYLTLLLTIAIELAVVVLLRRCFRPLRDTPIVSACVCVNLLTHPIASMAYFMLTLPFLPVEGFVILAEAVAYRSIARLSWAWSAAIALSTNLASMSIGLIMQ